MSDAWRAERMRMVERQIAARGVASPRVLEAMRRIPRHLFVPPAKVDAAYEDTPLPIGHGQTISQPYIVARMTELLALEGRERVLEIGAGSGYQTAILAVLAAEVFAVERVPELARAAAERVARLGLQGVTVECFDGTYGWSAHAPYDAILVAAGSPRIPALLCDQLADGGRLVIPVGDRADQRLARVVRHGEAYETTWADGCRFVDLVGRYGWSPSEPPAA